jgi:membrane-associated phospholipid phosphatase
MQYEPASDEAPGMAMVRAGRGLALMAGVASMVLAPASARAEEDDPAPKEVYQVRLVVDGPIIAVGALAGLLRYTLASRFIDRTCPCDPSNINRFDRGAVGNDSVTADRIADVTVGLALGLPPLLDLLDVGASRAFVEDITVMSETVMIAILFQQIANIGVQRPRPLTYAGEPDFVTTDEGYLSFYAGHVSTGVAAVTAAAYTVRLRYGERIWPWLVTAAVGGSLAVERVVSGHHFPSDSLVGLATGVSIGLAVPWLHARTPGMHLAVIPDPGNSGLAIAGTF